MLAIIMLCITMHRESKLLDKNLNLNMLKPSLYMKMNLKTSQYPITCRLLDSQSRFVYRSQMKNGTFL